ncbi:hypothetical protein GGS23DRAFT_341421 [Durotheca rogersii]|uniref:uncharacterized protein n=1 Tax=Durotheca rogersii TaxID=419775 RepID=UPI00221F959F|nr:uncharacterized protein GGS23DRAFT_341421 [Durotheca rogersii]KAI5857425.1 hypothetical protein GGS23DRAFT_341421 [Durotheca rogersii]
MSALLYITLFARLAQAILTPPSTGPYVVGTSALEIVDYTRRDPFAPIPQPRDLVVSLFYPTNIDTAKCIPQTQIPDRTAAALEGSNSFPNGSLHNIVTHACLGAPWTQPSTPLLLFSPGLGIPISPHAALLAEIASYGWNVVAVDHPYESAAVEYPDGRIVYQIPSNATTEEEQLQYTLRNIEVRTADLVSVLDGLNNATITGQIPGLGSCTLRTDRVGVFGHSLGGATALQATANDTRFAVGANTDGSFWGDQPQVGTDQPFAILAGRNHTRENDVRWAAAWPNLRGFRREYRVHGAEHLAFTDVPLFRELWGRGLPPAIEELTGPINSTRIMGVQTAFLTSLFRRFLDGENDGLLDGVGVDAWPEVTEIE